MYGVLMTFVFGLAVVIPSVVFAFASAASIDALGRNPADAAARIFVRLIGTLVFVEGVALAAMLSAFKLFV